MDKDNNTRFDQFSRFEQKPEWEIPRTTSDFDKWNLWFARNRKFKAYT